MVLKTLFEKRRDLRHTPSVMLGTMFVVLGVFLSLRVCSSIYRMHPTFEHTGNAYRSISLEELDAFIAILYARGAYGARSLDHKGCFSFATIVDHGRLWLLVGAFHSQLWSTMVDYPEPR